MNLRTSIAAFAQRGARTRALVERLTYSAGAVLLLVLLSSWIVRVERTFEETLPLADRLPWSVLGLADALAVGLLALALFVVTPALVAATVAGERRAGTLDQLRTTPLDPLALAGGLVVGAPTHFYLLCAGPLALHILAGLTGTIALDTMVASTVVLIVGGLSAAVLALAIALAPRQEGGGALVALGVAALLGISALIAMTMAGEHGSIHWAFLHPMGALHAAMLQHDGLWRRLAVSSWGLHKFAEFDYASAIALTPLLGTMMSLALGALLLRAACRKLALPHLPLFSKPQALALFALFTAALIVPISDQSRSEAVVATFVLSILLAPLLVVLAGLATPGFELWVAGRRRARRVGWASDEATPHRLAAIMLALFVTLLWARLHDRWPGALDRHELGAFAWTLAVGATLPIYLLFGITRYGATATRVAFGAAIVAHLIGQMVGIGLWSSHESFGSYSLGPRLWLELVMPLGLAVPLWVALRQRALARRVIASS